MDALSCGHRRTPAPMGTGYAVTPEGERICYLCAEDMERADMAKADTYTAYVAAQHQHMTTWTGGHLARVVRHTVSRSGFHGSEVHTYRAVSPDGAHWYGRNAGDGMSITLHRAKGAE